MSNLFYDDERHIYINLDNGEEILIAENAAFNDHNFSHSDSYPPKNASATYFQDPPSALYLSSRRNSQNEIKDGDPNVTTDQLENDHQLALRLAAIESPPVARKVSQTRSPVASKRSRIPADEGVVYDNQLSTETRNLNLNNDSALENPPPGWNFDDWTLARALQSMEIEMDNEGQFESAEQKASSWRNQLCTASAFICLVQVIVMILVWIDGGVASQSVNPMIGPSAAVLVAWGAKEMSLMVYYNEWWRVVSPIGVHAGLWHILCNVFIQLRIGGYLNLLWGTPQFLIIYFASGIFGFMLSGLVFVDTVGVGSSGAILGMLTAWIVWIIFRWNKVPAVYHRQRNCQLATVVIAVAVTIGLSFTPYVDWAAHVGGAVQGILWGIVVLSAELEHFYLKWTLRVVAIGISAMSFTLVALKLPHTNPNYAILEYFDANDTITL